MFTKFKDHEMMDAGIGKQTITIKADSGHQTYWLDFWRYRHLILQLAWKDIVLRYRQTIVGTGWIVARPLLTTLILVIVFGKLAKLPSEGVPYPVFVFVALVPWQFITTGISAVSSSVVGNSHLIGKVYFPRLIIPLSSLGPCMIDIAVAVVLFFGMFFWYDCRLSVQFLACPWFIALTLAVVVGSGLWMAGLSVRYRDVIHGLPFLVQFGLYISPVGYGTSLVPEQYRLLFSINPVVGIIEGLRWSILGIDPYWPAIYLSTATSLLLLVSGIWFFRGRERTFADII